MFEFSEFDKEIIRKIINEEKFGGRYLNILDVDLTGVCITTKHCADKVTLNFKGTESGGVLYRKEKLFELVDKLQDVIIKAIKLIEYLESKNLLLTYEQAHEKKDLEGFGKIDINECNRRFNLTDEGISRLFIKYINRKLVPNDGLVELEKHNFVSKEERRFSKQLKQTWIAIVIALLGGIFAAVPNIYSAFDRSDASGRLALTEKFNLSGNVSVASDETNIIFDNKIIEAHLYNIDKNIKDIANRNCCGDVVDGSVDKYQILFEHNNAEITESGYVSIDEFLMYNSSVKDKEIKVLGFADTSGDNKLNSELSLARAISVKTALVARGVEEKNIIVEYYGENRLNISTGNGKREPLNKYVEIILVDNNG